MGPKAASLTCLLALVVCGCANRENEAAAVAERFHAALESGDGQAACNELSEETASKLEQQEKKPCEEAILSLELPKGGRVVDAHVYQTSAFTERAQGSSDFLDKGPAGWTVSAAGCKPTAPGQPYDCELED